jgi:hypothetical protein
VPLQESLWSFRENLRISEEHRKGTLLSSATHLSISFSEQSPVKQQCTRDHFLELITPEVHHSWSHGQTPCRSLMIMWDATCYTT